MNRHALLRAGLDVLHYTGLAKVAAPYTGGLGAIFMLHHVRPEGGERHAFTPNAGLEITPQFLDAVISFVRARGFRILSLEEVGRELRDGQAKKDRPFAVFTLDDGYRDNVEHAVPVFRRHDCPYTIFAVPAYADGKGELWWEILETAIARRDVVRPGLDGLPTEIVTETAEEKEAAWRTLYPAVRWRLDEQEQRRWTRRFAEGHGIDVEALCRAMMLNWDELRDLADDPLCSIGAHTVHHFALARLKDGAEVLREMIDSKERIAAELGRSVDTFAYPYGDPGSAGEREFDLAERAGFTCAVTTRKGVITEAAARRPTALPRVSLNGFYQKIRYVDVLLTGAPFALGARLAG